MNKHLLERLQAALATLDDNIPEHDSAEAYPNLSPSNEGPNLESFNQLRSREERSIDKDEEKG